MSDVAVNDNKSTPHPQYKKLKLLAIVLSCVTLISLVFGIVTMVALFKPKIKQWHEVSVPLYDMTYNINQHNNYPSIDISAKINNYNKTYSFNGILVVKFSIQAELMPNPIVDKGRYYQLLSFNKEGLHADDLLILFFDFDVFEYPCYTCEFLELSILGIEFFVLAYY